MERKSTFELVDRLRSVALEHKDPQERRVAIALLAEAFGFEVEESPSSAAIDAAAEELGVERPPVVLAPVDEDGSRLDRPADLHPFTIDHARALRSIRVDHAERVDVDRFEIRKPTVFGDAAEEVGFARGLELLRIVSKPIPGRDGWRRSGDGREWYSADWLGAIA